MQNSSNKRYCEQVISRFSLVILIVWWLPNIQARLDVGASLIIVNFLLGVLQELCVLLITKFTDLFIE